MDLKSVLEKHKQNIPDFVYEAEQEVLSSKKPKNNYKPNNFSSNSVGPRNQNQYTRPHTSYGNEFRPQYAPEAINNFQ